VNVLHLTLSLEFGGRRQVILGLTRRMTSHGVSPRLAVLTDDPGPPIDQAIPVNCLGRTSLFDRRAIGRLHELCRYERIDILHTHDAASQLLAALLRLRHPRTAPPALMTFHRSLDLESRTVRARWRNRIATALTGAVVGVSEDRRRHYIAVNNVAPRKVIAIPNAIDVEKFRPAAAIRKSIREELQLDENTIVLGAVGHFGHEKGLDLVLHAFKMLLAAEPANLRLLVAGNGATDDRQRLEKLAAECHGRVTFLGQRSDLARLYQAFDLLFHAPRQEAFGLVVAEAMASGIPVVATRTGGIPEIVLDGQTGTLVDTESPSALCDAARALIQSTDLRREYGKYAVEVAAQKFNLENQARSYLRLYNDLIARRLPSEVIPCEASPSEAAPRENRATTHSELQSVVQ
jgi:glycosyltransferase involved in cell wall biosynthesis